MKTRGWFAGFLLSVFVSAAVAVGWYWSSLLWSALGLP